MTAKHTRTPDALAAARDAHAQAVAATAGWQARLEQANAEAAGLEVGAATLVEQPERAGEVASERARLREYLAVAREALEAAQGAQDAAVADVLLAEADALEPELAKVRAELADYDAKVSVLLDQLVELTGRRWVMHDPTRDRAPSQSVSVTRPNDWRQRDRLAVLEAQQRALLAAAEGGDPTAECRLDDLPEPLQAGGYAACAAALARHQQVQDAQAEDAEQAAQAARLADACRALDVDPVPVGFGYDQHTEGEVAEFMADAERRTIRHRGATYDPDALGTVAALAPRKDALTILDAVVARSQAAEA